MSNKNLYIKDMKKWLFLIFFTFYSIFVLSQTEFNFNYTNYDTFLVSGNAKCGIGNLYCLVTKSSIPNAYGNYCYQIYFATNSYFYDCKPSRTYVPNIEVLYSDGKVWYYPYNYYKFWVTVGPTSLVYTLFHPNPYLLLKIKTGFVEPTIY